MTGFRARQPMVLAMLAIVVLHAAPGAAPRTTVRGISFTDGRRLLALSGSIAPEDVDRYVVGAKADQQLTVRLISADGEAKFRLIELTGELGDAAEIEFSSETTEWAGTVPDSVDYAIDVYTSNHGAEYTLQVRVQ